MTKTTKKKTNRIGYSEPTTLELSVDVIKGAVVVDTQERAIEVLEAMEAAEAAIKPVLEFIGEARKMVNHYTHAHAVPVIQLQDHYWRRVVRHSRRWVGLPSEMPNPKPKGAKSLKEICEGKTAKNGKKIVPLWQFITKRIPDPAKIDEAVAKGFIKQSEIEKAYIETPQTPFIQRFNGTAVEGDEDAE